MGKKMNLFVVITLVLVMSISTVVFAEDESSVTEKQDEISVTKSAAWTKYNGKEKDDNGNPYAEVKFKIDTTKASDETISGIIKGGDTDVVLVIDISSSMKSEKKIGVAKKAAKEFISEVMKIKTSKVRVGVVLFAMNSSVLSELSDNEATLLNKVDGITTLSGTNMQAGVYEGQKLLVNSKAANKIMIVLGDGMPYQVCSEKNANVYVNGATDTAANKAITEELNKYTDLTKNDKAAIGQCRMATNLIKDLRIVTIGYETNTKSEKVLSYMASNDSTGKKKMFYKANATATEVVKDLSEVFNELKNTVESYVIGNSLVDTIPAEFNLVDGTVKVNDTNIKANISDDKKTVTWKWNDGVALERKSYEMSLVMALDIKKIPDGYLKKNSTIFSNGKTIVIDADSYGSSIFGYGKNKVIKLKSPKLGITERMISLSGLKVESNVKSAAMDKSPETGDGFNYIIIVVAAMSLMSMIAAVVMVKKRRG